MAILTLDPRPLLISAPRAVRSFMMSSQGTSARTGVWKMAVRILESFLERLMMILYYDITKEKSRKKSNHFEKECRLIEKSNGWGITCGEAGFVSTQIESL
jgi:hypothetical protein